jgi:hypothetical protein
VEPCRHEFADHLLSEHLFSQLKTAFLLKFKYLDLACRAFLDPGIRREDADL